MTFSDSMSIQYCIIVCDQHISSLIEAEFWMRTGLSSVPICLNDCNSYKRLARSLVNSVCPSMHMDTPVLLLLVVLTPTLVQVQCSGTCSSPYPVIPGPPGRDGIQGHSGPKGDKGDRGDAGQDGRDGIQGVPGSPGRDGIQGPSGPKGDKGVRGDAGRDGRDGIQGVPGRTGDKGSVGPVGSKGEKGSVGPQGSTTLSTTQYDNIVNAIMSAVDVRLDNLILQNFFTSSDNSLAKCGIPSATWKRIAYFDTTTGDPCPSGLRTVSNTTTSQTACGRNVNVGCTSLSFKTNGNYTNVCGRTRGYQYRSVDAFGHFLDSDPIDSAYLDGISFTYGSPRTHLWSYAVGHQEDLQIVSLADCPCARGDHSNVPSYVQDNYYCESGFFDALHGNIAWEDPLWDGSGCTPANQCCDRYGWFHREVPTTSDDIEVRWCGDEPQENEDVFIDQLEIWVM